MSEIEDIERDLNEMWSNFQCHPDVFYVQTSFGLVSVRYDEICLEGIEDEEGDSLNCRLLTPDELAQFNKEFPSIAAMRK